MSHNSFNVRGFGVGGSHRDMSYFDGLPGEFRDLLNYAPANFSCAKVWDDLRTQDRFAMLMLYHQQIEKIFPGFEPLDGEEY